MNAKHWDLSHETTTSRFLHHVGQMRLEGKRPIVRFVEPKRSLDPNALIYLLYAQIQKQTGEVSVGETRGRCKLDYGLPILCRDNHEMLAIKGALGKLPSVEDQRLVMREYPITSFMSVAQCNEYLEAVIADHTMRGYSIILPSDEYGY